MLRPVIVVLAFAGVWRGGQSPAPPLERFLEASSTDDRVAMAALEQIAGGWKDAYTALFVDMARLMRPPRRSLQETAARPSTLDDEREAAIPHDSFDDLRDLVYGLPRGRSGSCCSSSRVRTE